MLVTADFEVCHAKNANVEQRDPEYDLPALYIFIGLSRISTKDSRNRPTLFDHKSSRKIALSAKVAFYPILSVP